MNRNEDKQAYPVLGAADWISLAAAPTFAIMACLRVFLVAARRTCSARPRRMRSR